MKYNYTPLRILFAIRNIVKAGRVTSENLCLTNSFLSVSFWHLPLLTILGMSVTEY